MFQNSISFVMLRSKRKPLVIVKRNSDNIARDYVHNMMEEAYLRILKGDNVASVSIRKGRRQLAVPVAVDAGAVRSGFHYPNPCGICLTMPRQISAFKECGHVICRACAEQLKFDAPKYDYAACPYCRQQSKAVTLYEIESENEEEEWRQFNVFDDELFEIPFEEILRKDARKIAVLLEIHGFSSAFRDRISSEYSSDAMSGLMHKAGYDINLKMEGTLREHYGGHKEDVYSEEHQRLEAPHGTTLKRLYLSALEAAEKRDKIAIINKLRMQNECPSPSVEYSRTCLSCHSSCPKQRSIFKWCGHLICRPCADKDPEAPCPICMCSLSLVNIFENLVGKKK